jgi:hypothetical protein
MGVSVATRLALASVVFISLALFYLNVRHARGLTGSPSSSFVLNDTGAEWPEAEDKVIVMAQLKNESTEWVLAELPE